MTSLGDPWEPHTCVMPHCDTARTLGGPLCCDQCRPHMTAALDAIADALTRDAIEGRPEHRAAVLRR